MVQQVLFTITPIVVNFLMNLIKKVPAYDHLSNEALKFQLRTIAFVLSIVSVLLTSYVTVGLDMTYVQVLVVGAVEFVLSQGTYLLFFKK